MPQYLKVTEAAGLLKVTTAAIYQWADDGTIPKECVLRVGRTVRIRDDFIDRIQDLPAQKTAQ